MKNRKLIAKNNLKKSLYLGGGMAAFTAAIGLAVSIPVYNKIKEELAKSTSKLSDLSSFMNQLTNKLGVPADSEFSTELAGGYQVVYSNGETKIYKNTASGKSLVMNMNRDGSVGSAAQLTGPAAQSMLGVIQNAQDTMSDDADAMDDILGPFVDDAEDTSLAMEATVTGSTEDQLRARNALAGIDTSDTSAVTAALAAGAQHEAEKQVRQKNPGMTQEQKDAEIARLKAEQVKKLEAAKAEAIKLAAAQAAEVQRQKDLQAAQAKAAAATDKAAALKALKDLQVTNAKDWLDSHKPNPVSYTGLDDDAILALKTETITDDIAAKQVAIQKARDAAAARAAAALKLATAQQDTHQMDHIQGGGRSNVLIKIAQSIPSTAKALMNAMFGYVKPGASDVSPANSKVQGMLETEILKQGMSKPTLDAFEEILKDVHQSMGTDWSTKVADFVVLANTYGYKETDISKLFVLSAKVTNSDQSFNERVYVGKTTDKSPRDFEGSSLKLVDKKLNDNIKDMANIIDGNTNIVLSKTAAAGIVAFLNGTPFLPVADQSQFAEMQKLALKASTFGDLHEYILNKIILDMGKKFLMKGLNIQIKASAIEKMIDDMLTADGTTEDDFLTQAAPTKSAEDFIGDVSKTVMKTIKDKNILNYGDFATGISNIISSSAFMANKHRIDELIAAIEVKDPIRYFEGIKNIIKSPLGLEYITDDKKYAMFKDMLSKAGKDQITVINNMLTAVTYTGAREIVEHIELAKIAFESKDLTKTLDDMIKILGAHDDKFIVDNLAWIKSLFKDKNISDIADLLNGFPTGTNILGDFDRVKALITAARDAEAKDATRTDIYKLIATHIAQAEKLNCSKFYGKNIDILMNTLVNPKDDITQALKDFLKYLTVPAGTGPAIDLTDPVVMGQVTAASSVTAKLATQALPPAEEKAVGDAMTSVIAAKALTQDQFKIVSTYTETVFKVFTDKVEAAKQLQKVLDPKVIAAHIQDIDTFNKWVEAIEKDHPGVTITKEMIEKYVWTKDITETPYQASSGSEAVSPSYMIVSAAYNDEDGKTYFVDHKSMGGTDTRDIAALEKSGDKTIVKRYDRDPDKSAGAEPTQSYISGQAIHDGKLYWMGLNDNRADPAHKADFLYIYDIHTKGTKTVHLSHEGTDDGGITGNVRMLVWADGKLYGALGDNYENAKGFIEINPTTGKYTYLGKDKGYTSFTDKAQGVYTWTSGAFALNGETYIISPTRLQSDHTKAWLTITKVSDGHESQIKLDGIDSNWDPSINAVGMIVGNYDISTNTQTIFYVDANGGVVKMGIKIDPTTKDPKIDPTQTMVLIGKDKPTSGTRGATFVNGAITVYGGSKVVYVADQTKNLNDIFGFLMEHKQ